MAWPAALLPPGATPAHAVLHDLGWFDPHTETFNDEAPLAALRALADAARRLCNCPRGLLTLAGADRVWKVVAEGRRESEAHGTVQIAPQAQAVCSRAISSGRFLEVADTHLDPRFADLPDGDMHWRFHAAAPLRLQGHAVGTLCVVDHTARVLDGQQRQQLQQLALAADALLSSHHAARTMARERQRLADLARASGDWLWELDDDLQHRWLSDEHEQLTGIPANQLIGQRQADEPCVDEAGALLPCASTLHSHLARRQPLTRVVTRLDSPMRGVLYISRSAVPVFDDLGVFQGWRGSARDVTRQVQAARERQLAQDAVRENEALRVAHDAAERASHAKSEFLSRVSHELRTPLNAIIGFAQLMALDREQALVGAQRHRLDGVRQAGQALLALVDDVLDLSRIEQGALSLRDEALDLAALLSASTEAVQPLAAARSVQINVGVAPGLQQVRGDAAALEQVLVNLLANAIQYNRVAGQVRIQLTPSPAEGVVALDICDQGEGLRPEQLAQLFQPFNRLGAERRRIAGTGLGLVIARGLARAMGGDIEAESHPGQGSRFRLLLRAAAASDAAPPTAGLSGEIDSAPAESRRVVLYVEDEPLNVLLMEEVFRTRPGWTLHVAHDGAAGVELASRARPELALIDMNLPDMTGLELLRQLRSQPATHDLPCVALSADTTAERMAAARELGFLDYWTKPVDLMRLLDRVAAVIDTHAAARAP